MKRALASIVLGAALLAPCGAALAEAPRPVEPRWGIKPEKSTPSILDFARWLSEKVLGPTDPAEPAPQPVIPKDPGPAGPDVVCPDRWHCPIG